MQPTYTGYNSYNKRTDLKNIVEPVVNLDQFMTSKIDSGFTFSSYNHRIDHLHTDGGRQRHPVSVTRTQPVQPASKEARRHTHNLDTDRTTEQRSYSKVLKIFEDD